MSRNIFVKFYVKENQVGKTLCLDRLKLLFDGWNSDPIINDVNNPLVKNAGEYWYEDFYGYVDFEKLPERYKSRIEIKQDRKFLHVEKDEKFDEGLFFTPTFEQLQDEDFHIKNVEVYHQIRGENQGSWYDVNCFFSARLNYEQKLKEVKDKLFKIKNLKDTIEYYRLSEEQKESLTDDIEFQQETADGLEDKIYMCQFMIDTLSMLSDNYGNYEDECVVFVYEC